jgi:hypothetical protein
VVQDEVVNDGAQHHFVVTSDFGIFPATGAAMLRTRVGESEAIAALKDARKSEVFADALKFQLLHPLRGAKMLIMEPIHVASSVTGGLLEFLAMPGRAIKFEWSDREVDDRVFVFEAKPRVSVRGGSLFVQSGAAG